MPDPPALNQGPPAPPYNPPGAPNWGQQPFSQLQQTLQQLVTAVSGIRDEMSSGIIGGPGAYRTAIVPQASAIALSSNVPALVTALPLGPGDWDVWAEVYLFSSGGVRGVGGWIAPALGLPPTDPQDNVSITVIDPSGGTTLDSMRIGIVPCRFNLTVPALAYFQAIATIASGTCSAYGKICARRVA